MSRVACDDSLVKSYSGLVISVARRFRSPRLPVDEDLIQEGHLGLTIAAQRFDPDRGVTLSTYAYHWIRGLILAQVCKRRGIGSAFAAVSKS